MATKSIKIDSLPKQIGLLAAALACLTGAFFAAKWCAANAMASNTIYREVAELAESLAPADPQTHYASAVLREKSFAPEDVSESIKEYERAAALAPNDFRTWLALGRARERAGERPAAEAALRKSLELAPHNSEVEWVLGNVLLRQNKQLEAFFEMRRAAETDRRYVNPTAATAWRIYGGDLAQIQKVLGDSPEMNASLVAFLAPEKRLDEALKLWSALPADRRETTFKESGAILLEQIIAAGKYRDALQMLSLSGGDAQKFAVGKIFNGDFEADVKPKGAAFFDWQIADAAQPQIGVDETQKHGGNRSLTVVFNSPTGREFRAVSQLVVVDAGARYTFDMFYKSDLKTSATVYWEIFDVTSGKVLAQTTPVSAVADWTNLKAEFVAPNTQTVAVRLARDVCKSTICPISGRVWFDDFSFKRN